VIGYFDSIDYPYFGFLLLFVHFYFRSCSCFVSDVRLIHLATFETLTKERLWGVPWDFGMRFGGQTYPTLVVNFEPFSLNGTVDRVISELKDKRKAFEGRGKL